MILVTTYALFARAQIIVNESNETPILYAVAESRYIPTTYKACSCVVFARQFSGKAIYGNASSLKANHTDPRIGDWVLFGNHVAVILGIQGSTLEIIEGNFNHCQVSKRKIDSQDKSIKGYI